MSSINKRPRVDSKVLDQAKKSPDERFASAEWDPRFSRVPKKAKRQSVDKRFKKSLISNPGFRDLQTPVDRFGRPKRGNLSEAIKEAISDDSDSDNIGRDEINLGMRDKVHAGANSAYTLESDDNSSSDDSSEVIDSKSEEKAEIIPLGKATERLAVLGLNWSCTRAVDIFASLESFCSPGEHVSLVEVHPSKFGLERLELEAKLGPQILSETESKVTVKAKLNPSGLDSCKVKESDDESSDESFGDERNHNPAVDRNGENRWVEQQALRKYEEERLKYYYAVVTFGNARAAEVVYQQCDGVEYAQSGLEFDLRFIPKDMAIDTKPRDQADKIPDNYCPPEIACSSLNTSTVKVSWDADDPERVILKKRAIGKHQEDEENLRAYLASSDDEQEENNEQFEKKKSLLLDALKNSSAEADTDMNMEVSFDPGMFEKGEAIIERKTKRDEQKYETPWQSRLRRQSERKSEKKKKRRADLEHRANAFSPSDTGATNPRNDFAEENGDIELDDPLPTSQGFLKGNLESDKLRRYESKHKPGNRAHADNQDFTKGLHILDGEEGSMKRSEKDPILMENVTRPQLEGHSKKKLLADAESDDEERRETRREAKRRRGKRRSQRELRDGKISKGSEKPSVVDLSDARFQDVFHSHLFAIDPTHPKYKTNETNEKILITKASRRKEAEKNPSHLINQDSIGKAKEAKSQSTGKNQIQELASRIKARSNRNSKVGR